MTLDNRISYERDLSSQYIHSDNDFSQGQMIWMT